MTDHSPRTARHPIGRFVDDVIKSAGSFALLVLILQVIVPEMGNPYAVRLLSIIAALAVARTAIVWLLKTRLRSRWPPIDSLTYEQPGR